MSGFVGVGCCFGWFCWGLVGFGCGCGFVAFVEFEYFEYRARVAVSPSAHLRLAASRVAASAGLVLCWGGDGGVCRCALREEVVCCACGSLFTRGG